MVVLDGRPLTGCCMHGRYLDAVQPVEDGLALVERGLVPTDCYWPGTDTIIHDVSSADTLKVTTFCRH